ncbi:CHASE3 domain-containing protein, partial [Actinoplanes sp. NPDC048791]|uniref:CHASE3 domain-containing protein n=1 Tax=Actinoplanes sp. NPDC048791 TaxID=3154623 RepID=UPI0033D4C040
MGWLHRIKYRLIAAFAVPLLVLCVVGAVAYRSTTTLEDNSGKVAHTYQVIEALSVVTSTLKDAETGQRGYLITGEDRYLAPYESAKQSIDGAITAVAELTSDNAEQQARITTLRPLVESKFAELADTIELRRTKGFAAAQAVVLTDKGKAVMDQIRTVIAELSGAETSLLGARATQTADTADSARAAVLVGIVIAALLVVVLAFLIARSILRPLSALTGRLSEIADGEGDLTRRVDESRKDEFGPLAAAFNRFVAKLAGTIRQIGDQATSLAAASEQLSASSQQIAGSAADTSRQVGGVADATES